MGQSSSCVVYLFQFMDNPARVSFTYPNFFTCVQCDVCPIGKRPNGARSYIDSFSISSRGYAYFTFNVSPLFCSTAFLLKGSTV